MLTQTHEHLAQQSEGFVDRALEFVDLLRRLVDAADIHLVLAMRDDYLYRCQDFDEIAPIFRELTPLPPPKPEGLRRALKEPAARRLYRFDSELLVDRIVAEARRNREQREAGYRERALKMYPWICGRCQREFTRANLHELTVHHRDHNHDNNPADGSNWELLCIYCHDNEHSRLEVSRSYTADAPGQKRKTASTYQPFANLGDLLKGNKG